MIDNDTYRRDLINTPRSGFLVASAIAAVLTVVVFLYEDEIVSASAGDGALVYVFLIVALVFATMGLLLCYRVPRVGNRLLGYTRLAADPSKQTREVKSDVQYSAGFKSDGAVEAKQLNSKRKMARHSRKRLAAITREMQKDRAAQSEQSPQKLSVKPQDIE